MNNTWRCVTEIQDRDNDNRGSTRCFILLPQQRQRRKKASKKFESIFWIQDEGPVTSKRATARRWIGASPHLCMYIPMDASICAKKSWYSFCKRASDLHQILIQDTPSCEHTNNSHASTSIPQMPVLAAQIKIWATNLCQGARDFFHAVSSTHEAYPWSPEREQDDGSSSQQYCSLWKWSQQNCSRMKRSHQCCSLACTADWSLQIAKSPIGTAQNLCRTCCDSNPLYP